MLAWVTDYYRSHGRTYVYGQILHCFQVSQIHTCPFEPVESTSVITPVWWKLPPRFHFTLPRWKYYCFWKIRGKPISDRGYPAQPREKCYHPCKKSHFIGSFFNYYYNTCFRFVCVFSTAAVNLKTIDWLKITSLFLYQFLGKSETNQRSY